MPPPTRATRADRSSPPKARWSASSPGFSTRPNSASSSASGSPFPSSRPRARSACRRSEERKSMSREVTTLMERVLYEVKKMVVGQDHFLERVMVAMLAQGHLLVEGVPGLAKTLTVKTLARTVRGSFKRIQFTPDLVPADLVGTRIYNQKSGDFSTSLGPVFCNLLLADEIKRAPARGQSALREVVQWRRVPMGFCVAIPRKGSGTLCVSPAIVPWRSCIT